MPRTTQTTPQPTHRLDAPNPQRKKFPMPLFIPSHALPLVLPELGHITLGQCDAEIQALQEIHRKAVLDFWATLKARKAAGEPGSCAHWNRTQQDMHQLLHEHARPAYRRSLQAPDNEHVSGIWNGVIARFDTDIQAELQMSPMTSFDLVAIITQDEQSTVVHRHRGARLFNLVEDALTATNEDGPTGFSTHRFTAISTG